MTFQHDCLADDIGVAAELPLPEGIAENRAACAASRMIVGFMENTTEQRLDLQDIEEAAAYPQTVSRACFAAGREIKRLRTPGQHTAKALLMSAYLLPLRIR
jgi:hypothetical protein